MIEVYSLGVRLQIKDLATPVLVKMSRDFAKLDVLAKSLNRELNLAGGSVAGLTAIGRATGNIDRNLTSAATRAAVLQRELRGIQVHPALSVGIPASGGGGHPRSAGVVHGGNLHVGPGGIGLTAGAVGLGMASPLIVTGAASVGGSMLAGKKLADAAGDLQMETIRFKALGVSEELTQEALKFAKGMNVYGSTLVENMRMMRDVQSIFRDVNHIDHAKAIAPVLTQMNASNQIVFGHEFKANSERRVLDMTKVIELRTGSKPDLFKPEADYVQKSFITSGGRVGPEEYMKLIGRGANAVLGINQDEFYFGLEPILQVLGGDQTGTGMATAFGRMALGRGIDRPAAELMGRLGLLKPGAQATPKGVKAGGFAYTELMAKSPIKFLYEVLLPALAREGITDNTAIFAAQDRLLGKTGGKVYGALTRERGVIETSLRESKHAASIDEITEAAKKSFDGAKRDFLVAWKDFTTTFGERVLPQATEFVKGAANLVRSVEPFLQANKGLVEGAQKIEPHVLGGPVRFGLEHIWNLIKNGGIKGPLKPGQVAPLPKDFNFINAGPGRPITVITKVELDRRQIAEAVTKVQSEELQRPPAGPNRFDPTMGPIYPSQSLTGAW